MNWVGGRLNRYVKRNGKGMDMPGKRFAKAPLTHHKSTCESEPEQATPHDPTPKSVHHSLNRDQGIVSSSVQSEQKEFSPSRLPSAAFEAWGVDFKMTVQQAAQQQLEIDIKEARKRLLEKSDWLQLSLQRPPTITFPSMDDVARIGRPRKILRIGKESPHNSYQRDSKAVLGKRKRPSSPSSPYNGNVNLITAEDTALSSTLFSTDHPCILSGHSDVEDNQLPTDFGLENTLILHDPDRPAYYLMNDPSNSRNLSEDLPSLDMFIAKGVESFDEIATAQYGAGECSCNALRTPVDYDPAYKHDTAERVSTTAKLSSFTGNIQRNVRPSHFGDELDFQRVVSTGSRQRTGTLERACPSRILSEERCIDSCSDVASHMRQRPSAQVSTIGDTAKIACKDFAYSILDATATIS